MLDLPRGKSAWDLRITYYDPCRLRLFVRFVRRWRPKELVWSGLLRETVLHNVSRLNGSDRWKSQKLWLCVLHRFTFFCRLSRVD
jgi:hypothetical protein